MVFQNLICDDIMEDAYENTSNPKFYPKISIGSDFMTTWSLRFVEKLQNLKNTKLFVTPIFDKILGFLNWKCISLISSGFCKDNIVKSKNAPEAAFLIFYCLKLGPPDDHGTQNLKVICVIRKPTGITVFCSL